MSKKNKWSEWNAPTLSLDDQLGFGKYSGDTLQEVLDSDPQYLAWALNEEAIVLDDSIEAHVLEAINEGIKK